MKIIEFLKQIFRLIGEKADILENKNYYQKRVYKSNYK